MSAIRKSLIGSPAGLLALVVALAASLLSGRAFAIDIPKLGEISPAVAEANPSLVSQRNALQAERSQLRTRTQAHNSVCDEVSESDPKLGRCTQELQALTQDVERHVEASKRFNAVLTAAIENHDALENARIAAAINAYAKRLSPPWSKEKLERLEKNLNLLFAINTKGLGREGWRDIYLRGANSEIAKFMDQYGDGPGLAGAGAGKQPMSQPLRVSRFRPNLVPM